VDLIKAFDTANHELLFELLLKHGAPEPLVDVIKRLHHDFSLKFTLDKDNKCDVSCSVGVRQGDNMASLSFLFLMQAFHEILHKECERRDRPMPFVLSPEPDDVLLRGQLIAVPRPETSTGSETTISDTLFVDELLFLEAAMKCATSCR